MNTEFTGVKVGLVGLGYWGKKLFRVFGNLGIEIVLFDAYGVVPDVLEHVTFSVAESYRSLIIDESITAIVIATPTSSHYELARLALEHKKHVWIEKPMTVSSVEARELANLAAVNKCVVYVDHTFLYTNAVQKIKELILSGELGRLNHISSTRANFGLIQPDVDVVYDLAVHDLAIIRFVTDAVVSSVQAHGTAIVTSASTKKKAEVAHVQIQYENGMNVQINVSWLSPIKIRTMMFVGDKKTLVYDDTSDTEKIVIYNQRMVHDAETGRVKYEIEDRRVLSLQNSEALGTAAERFLEAILGGKSVLTTAEDGVTIVALLEKISSSIRLA